MFHHQITRQEKNLVLLLRWWTFFFIVAALAFAIFPDDLIVMLNTIGHTVLRWKAPPVLPSSERFWLVLTMGYMVMLIVATIKAQLDIVKNISYVRLIILAKITTTLGFLLAFAILQQSFAYLAGAIIDGLIFIITLIAYRRAIVSRYIK